MRCTQTTPRKNNERRMNHGSVCPFCDVREQDRALGRFRAANPITYTDPTGCEVYGEHKDIASTYMGKADLLEPIKMNISEREQRERSHQLQKTKDDYQKMLDDQFIEYRFYSCELNNGKQETRFACDENGARILNGNGDPILEMFCNFREAGSVFHESRHGGQFARGEVGYDDDNRQVTGFGIAQEVDAYKAQYSEINMMSLPIAVPAPFKLLSPFLSSPMILRIPGINGYELLNKSIDSYDEITPDLIRSIYERQGNQYQFIYDSLK